MHSRNKTIRLLLLALPWLLAVGKISGATPDSITCRIHGTVSDRPDAQVAFIIESGKDSRVHQLTAVLIKDGKFDYTLRDDMPKAYNITFDDERRSGTMTIRNFFTGNGEVELKCGGNGAAVRDTIISDIPDNIIARNWETERNEKCLDDLFGVYADMEALQEKSGKNAEAMNDSLTARAIELLTMNDSIVRRQITENPSFPGLFKIKDVIQYHRDFNKWCNIDDYIRIFETFYKEKWSSHPYTQEIITMIDAMKVAPGNIYPDFTITRPDGSKARIGSLIKGKTAVIDLWASWCAPCRKHSKELIPLYEKYRDKGFTLIAVAREEDNCDAMEEAMIKDGYPWESFVDINDRDNVWKINNAGNSGGKIILVDSEGKIVGTDLSTREIEAFLQENCK